MKIAGHIYPIFFILFLCLQLVGCQSDVQDEQREMLLGKWELTEATRDGRYTESLDELFFEFYQDGEMRTNLSGRVESATYELEDNLLLQRESQIETDYQIEQLDEEKLMMSTNLRGSHFVFTLERSIQEE
ncbi:MAG: lipocalin family protein [Saprospiraceae bacterium]|nr:lipocalin family protein [Saprospiraceae bacterium]